MLGRGGRLQGVWADLLRSKGGSQSIPVLCNSQVFQLILGVLFNCFWILSWRLMEKLAGIAAGTSGEVPHEFRGVKCRSGRDAAGLCWHDCASYSLFLWCLKKQLNWAPAGTTSQQEQCAKPTNWYKNLTALENNFLDALTCLATLQVTSFIGCLDFSFPLPYFVWGWSSPEGPASNALVNIDTLISTI